MEDKNTPYQLTIWYKNGYFGALYFKKFSKMFDAFIILHRKRMYKEIKIRVGTRYFIIEKMLNLHEETIQDIFKCNMTLKNGKQKCVLGRYFEVRESIVIEKDKGDFIAAEIINSANLKAPLHVFMEANIDMKLDGAKFDDKNGYYFDSFDTDKFTMEFNERNRKMDKYYVLQSKPKLFDVIADILWR